MTKQLKKGLVAVLIVLMAVLVGFTSNAVVGQSKADEPSGTPQEQIQAFEAQVRVLKKAQEDAKLTDKQITDEKFLLTGILGDVTEEHEAAITVGGELFQQKKFKNLELATTIWSAYNAAKTQIPELTKFALVGQIDSELLALYRKYDDTFSKVGAYKELIRFSSTMKAIADGFAPYTNYKSSYELVEEMTDDILVWIAEGEAYEASLIEEAKECETTLHYYLYYSSGVKDHYHEYFRALGRMEDMEADFDAIDKLIDEIKYYDETDKTLEPRTESEDEAYSAEKESEGKLPVSDGKDQTIVESSRESVEAVTEEIETREIDPADYEFIEGYADYEKAVERLAYWDTLKEEVEELIEAAYAEAKPGEVYFTIRNLIKKANDKYDELKNASRYEQGDNKKDDYNDLQSALDETVEAHLTEMNKKLSEVYENIHKVEALIEKIDDLDKASYTKDYRAAIEAAEEAFAKLDKDIANGITENEKYYDAELDEGHDVKVYPFVKEQTKLLAENKAIEDKRKAEGYKPEQDQSKADDDATLEKNNARLAEIKKALAEDDKYMDIEDAFIVEGDFIVKNFDKLMEAREQFDSWTAIIKERMERVNYLIELQKQGGEGVAAVLNELRPIYEDTDGKYWFGADPMYHKSAFLYAATKEREEAFYIYDDKTEDIFGKYMDKYDFLIKDSPYPPRKDTSKPVTNYEVLSYFYYLWDRIQAAVGDIDERIKTLHDNAEKAGCVYGYRGELVDLYTDFKEFENYKLEDTSDPADYTNWISGKDMLLEMYEEYTQEEALVKAWAELAKDLKVPVSVADFEKIKAAEDAFNAIKHYVKPVEPAAIAEIDFGAFLKQTEDPEEDSDDMVYKTMEKNTKKYGELFPELRLDYSETYTTYERVIAARDQLENDIKAAAKAMADIVTEIEGNKEWDADNDGMLDLEKLDEWVKTVDEATRLWNKIADKVNSNPNKTEEVDYTGAQDYLKENFPEDYANYEVALRLVERYRVEAAIEKLPEAKDVTLADREDIINAWKLHNEYLKKYAPDIKDLDPVKDKLTIDEYLDNHSHVYPTDSELFFRNDKKLHDCMHKLEEIDEGLEDWMIDVLNTYRDEKVDDNAALSEIDTKLDEMYKKVGEEPDEVYVVDEDKIAKEAYPLAIAPTDKKGNKYEPNTADLLDFYNKNIKGDNNKETYVEKAKKVLDALMAESDRVIEELLADINEVSDKIADEGLTAENIEEVQRIKDFFDKLHPTQQDKVQPLRDEYLDALDTLNAIAAFKNMVGELYREVVKEGNVTSFVQFYIDIVTNLYNQFPAGIRQAFDVAENENCIIIAKEDSATGEQIVGYTDIMAAIQAAYDEVGDEGAFHLNAVQKMIEDFKAELIAALQEAMAMDADDAIPSIADALKSFEANITASYQAAIKEAIEGENGVNKQIESLNSEIATLKEQIKTLQAAAGDKTALEAITSRLTALEQNIQALQTALGELTEFKTTYEDLLKDIKDGKYATDEELTTALNTFETQKLAPALNRLTTAEGDITTLKSQVSNIEGRLAVVEEQAKKAYEELFGTDGKSDTIADLEAQIAALESKLGTAGEGEDDSIEARIADLKTQLATLKSQLDAFQAKVDAAVSLGDRVAALESAKTALENADKQLQTNIDNLKKDLEDKINGLQEQIDSLKSTSTTLTVLVIILAVMVLAALACIVLLFIKRNKSNN